MSQASLVIRNRRIVDGRSAEGFVGDVAMENGKIVAVGQYEGKRLLALVGPGLDFETHALLAIFFELFDDLAGADHFGVHGRLWM